MPASMAKPAGGSKQKCTQNPKDHKPNEGGHKAKRKKRKNEGAHQEKQQPPVVEQEADVELEDDDYALLAEFGDRIDFLTGNGAASLAHDPAATPRKRKREEAVDTKKRKEATTDDSIAQEEEVYEKQSRKVKKKPQPDVVDLLPFKASDGSLVYGKSRWADVLAMTMQVDGVRVDDETMIEEDEEAPSPQHVGKAAQHASTSVGEADTLGAQQTGHDRERFRAAGTAKTHLQDNRNDALQSARVYHSKAMRRTCLQEQIATNSSNLLEDPESNLSCLRALLELTLDEDTVVQRLALLSLSSIFKDILPGYRIRDLTAEEQAVKVTKAVQKLRDYENALLRGFQSYVKVLRSMLAHSKHTINHQRVAVKCLGELLTGVPHFNCMRDVLEALVHSACGMDARCRTYACTALETLMRHTQHTDVMVDAVQLAVDAVYKAKCMCPHDIVYALLAVKFKDLSRDDVEKGSQALKRKFKFKTRRRREDAIAAALQEAAIAADKDQVRLHQIQILEALFEMFFRVLKRCTSSGLVRPSSEGSSASQGSRRGGDVVAELFPETIAKKWPLLSATLQGLAKYTHLIGLEYFNDLMEVLQQLQGCSALPLVLRMRCLLTTVDILHSQNDALNVDRKRMYAHLYNALSICALQPIRDDEEATEAGIQNQSQPASTAKDAAKQHRRNNVKSSGKGGAEQSKQVSIAESIGSSEDGQTSCSVLVAKTTMQLLMALKPGDAARLGAFVKRLCACALHAEPGLCIALLAVTARLLQRHTKLHGLLEGEAVGSYGQGGYDPFQSDPMEARALSSSLWELSALLQHSNKDIARTAQVAAGIADGSTTSADLPHSGKEPHEIIKKLGDAAELVTGWLPAQQSRGGSTGGKRSKLKADKKLRMRVACPEASPVVVANIWCYLGTVEVDVECTREEPQQLIQEAAQEFQSMFGEDKQQQSMRRDLYNARKTLFRL